MTFWKLLLTSRPFQIPPRYIKNFHVFHLQPMSDQWYLAILTKKYQQIVQIVCFHFQGEALLHFKGKFFIANNF